MTARGPWRWLRWVIAAAVVIVVLAVAVPFIFFHFVDGSTPAPLSLKASAAPSSAQPASAPPTAGTAPSVAGSWRVSPGSQVGYRVQEILLGQHHTAVGRSGSVSGQMVIRGTTVRTASFTVQMATIHTDSAQRDAQFDGRIMDVAAYPTGKFVLTRPVNLAPVPAVGAISSYTATGQLTLRGHSVLVTFPVRAERTSSGFEIQGSIRVLFSRWDIPNPSFTGFVTTQNHGIMEFLLDFKPG
ncbi:MAG TPA: YceI family protein [Streptosporangiaceae bacterium]|nr:YceI family protein [Streptosporangiaceae bacterium]